MTKKYTSEIFEISQIVSEAISTLCILRDTDGLKNCLIEIDVIQGVIRGLINASDTLDDIRGKK